LLDKELRRFKDLLLVPAAKLIGQRIHPIVITVIGFFVGAASMVFLYYGNYSAALWLWAANRILDGLDGLVARHAGKMTDLGGFLDIVADFFLYAAVPIVFAFKEGSVAYFRIVAVLLAAYYLNASIWMSVSAIMEKRNCTEESHQTTLIMPRGIVEGFETIIFYTLMFIFPSAFIIISIVMAALLGAGIILRLTQAVKLLKTLE
jgi:phosphatidylglycerophosphate synthase